MVNGCVYAQSSKSDVINEIVNLPAGRFFCTIEKALLYCNGYGVPEIAMR